MVKKIITLTKEHESKLYLRLSFLALMILALGIVFNVEILSSHANSVAEESVPEIIGQHETIAEEPVAKFASHENVPVTKNFAIEL